MKVSQVSGTNFEGVRLLNPAKEHVDYVKKLLKANGVYVAEHGTYRTADTFESKSNIANFMRSQNNFLDNECGIMFLPFSRENWIIGNKSFEQTIKKILNSHFIDSEINLGI